MNRALSIAALLTAGLLVGCQTTKNGAADCCGPDGCKMEGMGAKESEGIKSDIKPEEVPTKVMAAFTAKNPGVAISEAEKEVYPDGSVHYELEWKDASGKEMSVEMNADGEVLEDH